MSADPDSSSAPDPNAAPADTSAQAADKFQFPQVKRRFKRELDAPGPSGGDEPAAGSPENDLRKEIDSLTARLQTLADQRKEAPAAPAEAEARNAKYFRLTRKANAPAPAREPGAAPAAEPAAPVQLAGPPTTRVVMGHYPTGNAGWLLASIGVLLLTALAFFLGTLTNRPSTSTAATPVVAAWSEPDITKLDRVRETERSGNLRGAYEAAENLDKQLGGRPNLEGYSSVLEARSGRMNDAEADLVRKANPADPPREFAAAQERLGFVYARRRDFKSAVECFSSAATADPLDPLAFYYWGETLRRTGRLPEAIGKFQEVLLRLPAGQPESDSLWQCAAFRLRLTQIELGNDAEVKTALDAQLRRPVPSVYWLLTAVVYDLQHNDVPGALAVLQRVKVVAQPELVDALFNDYFLRALAVRNSDIATYFPELTAERRKQLDAGMAYFIDP